ncbi:MAG: hypothetical protein HOP09_07725 [Hyphomicrobium sp.]|nr:hypothetical protein [Hyphomicrobium sp.]
MNTYFALVHKDVDSAFGISFPDLPGCFSAADEEDDVFRQAQTALTLFASDQDTLPAARTLSQLRADAEVCAEIDGGAFVIAVPLVIVTRKLRYNLMLGSDLVEAVDFAARAIGVSRSEFVSDAIGHRLTTQAGAVLLRIGSSGKFFGAIDGSSKSAKSVAASALTQTKSAKETSSKKVASAAAKILKSKTASKAAKSVAASALTQKTKAKKAAKKK